MMKKSFSILTYEGDEYRSFGASHKPQKVVCVPGHDFLGSVGLVVFRDLFEG